MVDRCAKLVGLLFDIVPPLFDGLFVAGDVNIVGLVQPSLRNSLKKRRDRKYFCYYLLSKICVDKLKFLIS
jgi:hypothetical protein